jgi:hypothetical protein
MGNLLRICRCKLEVCLGHERLVLLWENLSYVISGLFIALLFIHIGLIFYTMHTPPPPPYVVEIANVSLKLQVINLSFNLSYNIILPFCSSLLSCSSILF